MTNSAHEHRRATPPAGSPGGDRMVAESSQAAYAQRLCDAVRKRDHSAVCAAGIRCICGYDDRVLELADAADFVLSSPPPAVERREQIARIIDPSAFRNTEMLLRAFGPGSPFGKWRAVFGPSGQASRIRAAYERADAILALPPQAAPGVVAQHEYEFEVHQGWGFAASACSESRAKAAQEALHYAAVYGQDGPVTLFELTRTLITIEALAALSAERS